MVTLDEYPCHNHTDRIAFEECTMYPCIHTHLCEECSALHGFCHGSNEIVALEKTKSSLVILKQEIDKQLGCCAEVESRLKAFSQSQSVLSKMVEIHQTIPQINFDVEYLLNRIKEERSLLSGKSEYFYRSGPLNCEGRFEELSKKFSDLKSQYEKLRYSSFMKIYNGELSWYFDANECSLVLVHLKAGVKISINLTEYGIKSCKTFTTQAGPSIEKVGNAFYLLGGLDKPEASRDLWVLSLNQETHHVKKLASMNYARYNASTISVCGRYIYAIGGSVLEDTAEKNVNFVERYDIVSNQWTKLPCLNFPRANSGVANIDSRFLFVCGGSLGDNKEPEYFDTLDEGKGWNIIEGESWDVSRLAYIAPGQALIATKDSVEVSGVIKFSNKKKAHAEIGNDALKNPLSQYRMHLYFLTTREIKVFDTLRRRIIKVKEYY